MDSKNSIEGNNSSNRKNDNNRKNNISDYRKSKIAVPRDRDGAFKPKVFKKRQIRTDEIKQKAIGIFNIYLKGYMHLLYHIVYIVLKFVAILPLIMPWIILYCY